MTSKIVGATETCSFKDIKKISGKNQFIAKYCAGKQVLSIGCVDMIETKSLGEMIYDGEHQFASIAAKAKYACGIDVNQGGVSALKSKGYSAYYWNILGGDGEDVLLKEIEENIWDVVVVSHVIEHVPACYEFLKTIVEKFTFNEIIVAVPNQLHINRIYDALVGKKERTSNDHYYTFSPVTFTKFCEACGITKIDMLTDKESRKINMSAIKTIGIKRTVLEILKKMTYLLCPNALGDLIIIGKKNTEDEGSKV